MVGLLKSKALRLSRAWFAVRSESRPCAFDTLDSLVDLGRMDIQLLSDVRATPHISPVEKDNSYPESSFLSLRGIGGTFRK